MKELFIVEGVAAANNLRRSLDKANQQVHALQGKLINSDSASLASVLQNDTCQQLINVLGCAPGDLSEAETVGFSKILILCDPDIDGRHASALLMSFFNRYYHPLVEQNKLSLIKAPLYRVQVTDSENRYVDTEAESTKLSKLNQGASVIRFKGIAQFSVSECRQLLLHPDTRREYVLNT